jgi:hypothetical protein
MFYGMQFVVLRLNRTCAALAFMYLVVVNSWTEISIQAADNNDWNDPQDRFILNLMLFGNLQACYVVLIVSP